MMKSIFAITSLMSVSVSSFVPSSDTQRHGTILNVESSDRMSQALPFLKSPRHLDGTLAGDVGFDPLNFSAQDKTLLVSLREAEIKHSRLAMLAVVGWPLAELFDKPIAESIGLPILLTKTGASPSLLNGGLERVQIAYWVMTIAIAGMVEMEAGIQSDRLKDKYIPGDCNFDPLGLFPKDKKGQKEMLTREIKHGRIAMMAVLGFATQEALYQTPVVSQTPFFFHSLL